MNLLITCDFLGALEKKTYFCYKKRLCIIFGSMKVIKRERITPISMAAFS